MHQRVNVPPCPSGNVALSECKLSLSVQAVSLVCKQVMTSLQAVNTDKNERDRYESGNHNRHTECAAGGQRRVPVRSPVITYTNSHV